MTKEIIDNNKLIAEFMGYFVQCRNSKTYWVRKMSDTDGDFKRLSTLKYHSDWNCIMNVCQKIDNIRLIVNDSAFPYIKAVRNMKDGAIRFDLEKTYLGVVEFIKWYNEKKGND